MERSIAQLKKYRSRFARVFALSSVLLVLSVLMLPAETSAPPQSTAEPALSLPMLISIGSLLTSVTSLIGFLFTTGIAWRKERREQLHAELDLETKKLEVEKLRLELEGKRKRSSPVAGGRNGGA